MATINSLANTLSGQTGTGSFVGSTSPTLVTPTLGVATATSLSLGATGSWTPALTFGNGNTGITYTTQYGKYQQIGNVVFFAFFITLSNKGSSTGSARVTGVPVAPLDTNQFMALPYVQQMTVTALTLLLKSNAANNFDLFFSASASNTAPLTDTNFANNTSLAATGCYFAA